MNLSPQTKELKMLNPIYKPYSRLDGQLIISPMILSTLCDPLPPLEPFAELVKNPKPLHPKTLHPAPLNPTLRVLTP